MSETAKFVLIAALEREIQPLLHECRPVGDRHAPAKDASGTVSHPQRCFRYQDAVVICAGPGDKNAGRAAQQVLQAYAPEMVISIGFAGALAPDVKVGDVFVPRHVISERTESSYTLARGRGVLVTAERVAGEERKRLLFSRFGAQAVDMEAAAVAAEAAARGCEFMALKVISDTLASNVEFVNPFVRPEGFRAGAFLAHVSIRPWLWPAVRNLQRDSARAAENLCAAVRVLVSKGREVLEELYGPACALESDIRQNLRTP